MTEARNTALCSVEESFALYKARRRIGENPQCPSTAPEIDLRIRNNRNTTTKELKQHKRLSERNVIWYRPIDARDETDIVDAGPSCSRLFHWTAPDNQVAIGMPRVNKTANPSDAVGCANMASRSAVYGMSPSIAV
jgi:hypothetical protein